MKVAISLDANAGWESPVSFRFARAPFFAIVEIKNNKATNLQIIPNPNAMGRGGVGPAVANWLASMGVTMAIGPRAGPNAMMAMNSLGIQFRSVPPGVPLRQALASAGFSCGE